MASGNITVQTNLAGNQSPSDLVYVGKSPFGPTDDRKSTLDDLFSIITKNITDGAVRFQGFATPALSAAGAGALFFNSATNTFQGSRNAGAYANLLFGAGANERISVWGSAADQITSYAQFQFNPASFSGGNNVCRITGNGIDGNFWVENTNATNPSYAVLNINGRTLLRRLQTGAPPFIDLSFGRAAGSFPQSLDVIGYAQFSSTNNVTSNESATIKAVATQNHTGSAAGGAVEIWNSRQNQTAAERRAIFGAGSGSTVLLAPAGSYTATTNVGNSAQVAVGFITTPDNAANMVVSNQSGGLTAKTLVLQAVASQTGALFELQSSAGAVLYQITSAGAISQAGALVITSNAAAALAAGPNGNTNPAFRVVCNVASAATGLSITGNAAGSGVTLSALSSGTDESILVAPKGAGIFKVGIGPNASAQGNTLIYATNSGPTNIAVRDSSSGAEGAFFAGGSNVIFGSVTNNDVLFNRNGSTLLTLGASSFTINTVASLASYEIFAGISAPAVSAAGTCRIYFDSGSNTLKASQNGAAYVDVIGGGGTVNAGTAGQITYYAANGTVVSGTSILTVQTSNSQLLATSNGTDSLLEIAQNGTSPITLAQGGAFPFLLCLHVVDGASYNAFLYYSDASPDYTLNFPLDAGGLGFFVQEKTTDNPLSGLIIDSAGLTVQDSNFNSVNLISVEGYQQFLGVSAPAVAPAGTGRIYFDSTANKFKVSENGGAYVNLI